VYGQSGPLAQEWGVDGTGAALSGRTYLTGWPDRPPVTPGAVPYGDVIVPYVMAGAVAAAVANRDRTGQGCHIDASMYEICVQQMSAALREAASGTRPARAGNRDAGVFHQGVYPAAGDDQWLALTLDSPEDWRRLARVIGLSPTEAERGAAIAAADERDACIAGWTATREAAEMAGTLQAAGLAAGAVQDVADLVHGDPQLASRGMLRSVPHPVLGAFPHLRTPLTFSRTPAAMRPAPRLGEHGEQVARELAGLDEPAIAALRAAGVFR
jgi:crotonobetainyl-CoA:carnitine CoA-transferase CaiB-like acyl-CoA transferase